MMRTRAERRRKDWVKAIRKRRITRQYPTFDGEHSWYNNLHQYSKNKIHCSCPLCRCKTNDKSASGPAMNWPVCDRRQLDNMRQGLDEYKEEAS